MRKLETNNKDAKLDPQEEKYDGELGVNDIDSKLNPHGELNGKRTSPIQRGRARKAKISIQRGPARKKKNSIHTTMESSRRMITARKRSSKALART